MLLLFPTAAEGVLTIEQLSMLKVSTTQKHTRGGGGDSRQTPDVSIQSNQRASTAEARLVDTAQ